VSSTRSGRFTGVDSFGGTNATNPHRTKSWWLTSWQPDTPIGQGQDRTSTHVARHRGALVDLAPDHDAWLGASARLLLLLVGARAASLASPCPSRPLARFEPALVGVAWARVVVDRGQDRDALGESAGARATPASLMRRAPAAKVPAMSPMPGGSQVAVLSPGA
jgi:hypothetical protein